MNIKNTNNLVDWLYTDESLTTKAELACTEVSLQLLNKDWCASNRLSDGRFCREIVMYCDAAPWWYAKTIVPYETFIKRESEFSRLGQGSLGSMLFNDTSIERLSLNVYTIDSESNDYKHLEDKSLPLQLKDPLWVRDSIFEIAGSQLYLKEIFLPCMLAKLS